MPGSLCYAIIFDHFHQIKKYDKIDNIEHITGKAQWTMKDIILYLLCFGNGVIDNISYIPQIIKLLKTKKSEGIAVSTWIMWSVGDIFNIIYAILLGRYELIIYSAMIFCMNMTIIVLSIKYNKTE